MSGEYVAMWPLYAPYQRRERPAMEVERRRKVVDNTKETDSSRRRVASDVFHITRRFIFIA